VGTFLLIPVNLLIYAKSVGDQPTADRSSGECELLNQVREMYLLHIWFTKWPTVRSKRWAV